MSRSSVTSTCSTCSSATAPSGIWSPKGEPQLGARPLPAVGGSFTEGLLLWVLNLSDGEHDLLAIAERSGLTFAEVADAADALVEAGLLAGIDGNGAAA